MSEDLHAHSKETLTSIIEELENDLRPLNRRFTAVFAASLLTPAVAYGAMFWYARHGEFTASDTAATAALWTSIAAAGALGWHLLFYELPHIKKRRRLAEALVALENHPSYRAEE